MTNVNGINPQKQVSGASCYGTNGGSQRIDGQPPQSKSVFDMAKPDEKKENDYSNLSSDIRALLEESDRILAHADETLAQAKAQLAGDAAPTQGTQQTGGQPAKGEIPAEGEYTDDELGKTYTVTHNQDGGYTKTYDDRIRNYDASGRWVSGKSAEGTTYTREYNADGSCVEKYSDGEINNYDKDGRDIGGTNQYGDTWTREYSQDGSSVRKWSNGEIDNYDKDGKRTGGVVVNSVYPDGIKYRVVYNKDGSYEERLADSKKFVYDAQGRETHYENEDGTEWCNTTYNDDGSSVETWNSGQVSYNDKAGKETGGKLADGTTYTTTYDDEGNQTRTFSDGTTAIFDKSGKRIKDRS